MGIIECAKENIRKSKNYATYKEVNWVIRQKTKLLKNIQILTLILLIIEEQIVPWRDYIEKVFRDQKTENITMQPE